MSKELIDMPDGKGGFKKVEAEKFSEGAEADMSKQEKALQEEQQKAHEERVGKATEEFNRFHKAYATDYNLTEEELVKATYLELLNLKEFYPKELGGSARVDEVCREAWEYFEKHKHQA